MGVILYKAGDSHVINGIKCHLEVFDEYSYLHNLENGWFYSPEECYAEENETEKEKSTEKEPDHKESPEKTGDESGERVLTLEETLRAKAKDAGIKSWWIKSIANLEKELANGGNKD